MRKQTIVLCLGISALLLMCMLAYPAGYDQAVFSAGGRMIIEQGAVPSRDFLDTKPPVIFYMYGAAHALFGDGIVAIRIMDILLQALGLFLFYRILTKVFAQQSIAVLSVLIYTILYVSSGYWMTAQCESYALIPSVLAFAAMVRFETEDLTASEIMRIGIMLAVCTVFLFFLKYTLAALAIGIVGFALFSSTATAAERRQLVLSFGAALVLLFGLAFVLFQATNLYGAFLENLAWAGGYSNISPPFDKATIRQVYFLDFPSNLLQTVSPTFFIISIIGFYNLHTQKGGVATTEPIRLSSVRSLLYWFMLSGFLGVLVERKSMTYHYSRVFWIFAIVISVACMLLMQRSVTRRSWRSYAALGLLALPVLFYSPLTRIISHPLQWTWLKLSGDTYAQHERLKFDRHYGHERAALTAYFSGKLDPNDQVFVWGHFMEIYSLLGKTPTTIGLTNTPLVTRWTPQSWRQRLIEQLTEQRVKYILIEHNDAHPLINGRTEDSYAMMQEWPEFRSLLETQYTKDTTVGSFSIYSYSK